MEFLILIFLGVLAVFVCTLIKIYNELSKLNLRVNRNFSSIDTQLSKRHAVIKNLLGCVGKEQKEVLEQFEVLNTLVDKADSQRNDQELYLETEKQISQSLGQILTLSQIQKINGFQDLKRQIVDIEEELFTCRGTYNDSVEKFNIYLESFPWGLMAKQFLKKFKEKPYFEASAYEKNNGNAPFKLLSKVAVFITKNKIQPKKLLMNKLKNLLNFRKN